MRDGAFNESAPLRLAPPAPKLATVFRRNDTFAVWDERGLTIRVGKSVRSFRLPSIPLSPKAFTRDEILFNQREIKAGRRSVEVAALSGALRVANRAYFLARWEDSKGKPWVEAMVEVDLSQKIPMPKFLARIHAMSLADAPLDDQMFILDGEITYVARKGDHWGIQQFDPATGRFSFDELGDRLESYVPLPGTGPSGPGTGLSSRVGLVIEKTAYGTTLAAKVDLATRQRRILAENRARMKFIDAADPACIVLSEGNRASVLNARTGSLTVLTEPCAMRRTSRGIVVWTPIAEPRRAWLFDPARWAVVAWWNADLGRSGEAG